MSKRDNGQEGEAVRLATWALQDAGKAALNSLDFAELGSPASLPAIRLGLSASASSGKKCERIRSAYATHAGCDRRKSRIGDSIGVRTESSSGRSTSVRLHPLVGVPLSPSPLPFSPPSITCSKTERCFRISAQTTSSPETRNNRRIACSNDWQISVTQCN
jgi:hypothetical protein